MNKPPRYAAGQELKIVPNPDAVGIWYPLKPEQLKSACAVTITGLDIIPPLENEA